MSDVKEFWDMYKKYRRSKRCRFLKKMIRNFEETGKYAQHELFIGDSGTGKNYLAFWMYEVGIILGKIKLYYLWCRQWSHLREVLTLMTKFNVRIYVPISQHMPKELPTIDKLTGKRGLVVPFTVSTDNLSKEAIHCLTGYKDPQQIYGEYQKLIKDGMNFSQLKRAIWKDSHKDILIEKGYMGRNFVSIHRSNPSTISGLSRRLGSLNGEGVLADTRYPFALEKLLPQEVRDQKTVAILYTGFLKNTDIRKLVMIYYQDVLKQTLQKYVASKLAKKFKHKQYLNEYETIAKPKEDKDASVMDLIIGNWLKKIVSESRHINSEIAVDVKGLENIDQRVRGKINNRYVTQLYDDKELSRATINTPHKPKKLLALFVRWKERGFYRFIDLHTDIPDWKWKNNREEGYELPRPRLCKDGKMNMEINDFRWIDGINMKESFNFIQTKIIQEQHADYLAKSEDRWIKEIENQKKKQKEKENLKDQKHDIRIRRVKYMQWLRRNYPDMTKKAIYKRLGISNVTMHTDEQDLKDPKNSSWILSEEALNLPEEEFKKKLNQGLI